MAARTSIQTKEGRGNLLLGGQGGSGFLGKGVE